MTSVHRPYRTPEELRSNREVSSSEAVLRIARGLFVITQPLMAAASVLSRLVLIRQRLIRPRWYLLGASLLLVGALVGGTVRSYLRPALDLVAAASAAKGLAGLWPAVTAAVSTSWVSWVVSCLPLAVAGGVFIGALGAARRSRRLPVWRDEKALAVPKDRRRMQRLAAESKPAAQGPGTPLVDIKVHLGLDETTRRPFAVTVGELMYHAYLDGPSGFGKTTTLVKLVDGLVTGEAIAQRRIPIVVVNMKPDRAVTDALRAIAKAGGRQFWHVTHDGRGSSTYNPLRLGTAHEISSAVMEAEAQAEAGGFTEPHHRAAGERYLQLVTQVLTALNERDPARWPRDYPTLARVMQLTVLEVECPRLGPELARRWKSYSAELVAERRLGESLSGLRQRIARAAESAAGVVLQDEPDGLVLEEAIVAGDVVLFDLDAAADTTAAQLVGNLALQDLIRTMSRLGRRRWNRNDDGDSERFALLAVDEFSALGGTLLADLFQRARSQGAGVVLSTQEAGSLDLAGEGFRETVITNTNVLLLHRQTVNAEAFAGYLGTESYLIETHQLFEERSLIEGRQVYASGQGNVKQGERFVLHPNVLRNLGVGELAVRVGSRQAIRPSIVAVQSWQPPVIPPESPTDPDDRVIPQESPPAVATGLHLVVEVDDDDGFLDEPGLDGWVWGSDDDTAAAEAQARWPDSDRTLGSS